jgi:hypothetical protein
MLAWQARVERVATAELKRHSSEDDPGAARQIGRSANLSQLIVHQNTSETFTHPLGGTLKQGTVSAWKKQEKR